MPNRILKDTIWDSDTLTELGPFAEDQFPRWLLLADDWGCFCADSKTIKGKAYPKRPDVTVEKVEELRLTFYRSGMLFCWVEGDRTWGYWTNFGEHNYLTSVDDSGQREKKRRRTPEPPTELLKVYLKRHGCEKKGPRAVPWDILEQDGTARDKTANSDSDPDLDSDSDLDSNHSLASVAARRADESYEVFAKAHQETLDTVYVAIKGDFVQLSKLRKANNIQGRASPPHWESAVKNYFSSNLSNYTLRDLCTRFAVFRNGAVDRFNKLGGNHGRSGTKQAIQEFVGEVDERIR